MEYRMSLRNPFLILTSAAAIFASSSAVLAAPIDPSPIGPVSASVEPVQYRHGIMVGTVRTGNATTARALRW